MTRIAHISDIHFGRIAHPSIVQALIDDINSSGADLVVVSGDLTQRALPGQYESVARMLAAFDAPYLVVAGNHDVFAWWRPHTRLLDPLRRYRKFITDDLSPGFTTSDLSVFGLNTAHGATIKGGLIRREQLEEMSGWFEGEPPGSFRILAVHHHVMRLPDLFKHDIARGSIAARDHIANSGIELILTGHLHVSHVARLDITDRARVVIASAGTATSDRGRKSHKATNYFNMIDVSPSCFTITEKRFDSTTLSWEEERSSDFER